MLCLEAPPPSKADWWMRGGRCGACSLYKLLVHGADVLTDNLDLDTGNVYVHLR